MTPKRPPRFAAWLLEHLAPGSSNESLAGDLLEELNCGRTLGWYWRQVIATIVLGCFREATTHSNAVLFALVWCMLAPSWHVVTDKLPGNGRALDFLWRIDWPWSTIGAEVLSTLVSLSFVWVGICVYFILQLSITRTIPIWRIRRGLILTIVTFVGTSAAVLVLVLALPEGRMIDRGTLTPLNVITAIRIWAVENRILALTSLLSALWMMNPVAKRVTLIRPSSRLEP
jgi:hypothetical protein